METQLLSRHLAAAGSWTVELEAGRELRRAVDGAGGSVTL